MEENNENSAIVCPFSMNDSLEFAGGGGCKCHCNCNDPIRCQVGPR